MTWIFFLCLILGLFFGLRNPPEIIQKRINTIINIALVILMLTIGLHIGTNESVMSNLPFIGFHCVVISFSAIAFSVILTVIIEKTLLPLDLLRERLLSENININPNVNIEEEENKKTSSLIWIMPLSIVSGVLLGSFLLPDSVLPLIGHMLTGSLVILLISIGISIGSNKGVFRYIRVVGFKVVLLSIAILIGSIASGFFSGFLLKLPFHITVISASGMSYYSLTGAYMTQVFGIEAGTYGFVVNVMREFFTVLLLPVLVKISKGSPIASGASGDMDTMLAPITRFVGVELGLVALITGILVSLMVTLLLPVLCHLFS